MSGLPARLTEAAKSIAALTLMLALAACDFGALMPKEHIDFAKAVVTLVQNRDAEGLEAVSDAALWQRLTPDVRSRMARTFLDGDPVNVDVASYRSAYDNGVTSVTVVLRYIYPQASALASVSFRTAEHGYVLTAIHVSPGDTPAGRDPNAARDS